jgi:hypothetical protein
MRVRNRPKVALDCARHTVCKPRLASFQRIA